MSQSNHPLIEDIQNCSSCSFRNPSIKPLPPDSEFNEVVLMFVGENPSWEEKQEVPFSPNTISGKALEKHYIKPLGLTRKQVWITDLFKCRYPKEVYCEKQKNYSLIQDVAKTCTNLWLVQEIKIAKPKIIVTLSDKQVFQRLRKIFNLSIPSKFSEVDQRQVLFPGVGIMNVANHEVVGKPHEISINGLKTLLFPMIHPDISRPIGDGDNRKRDTREKWSTIHKNHISLLKSLLFH